MRYTISIVAAAMISFNCCAQIDTNVVSFISYWNLGDSYDFKVSKTVQQWRHEQLIFDNKNEYMARFQVIDSTGDSYTIKWSYETNLESHYNVPEKWKDKFRQYENLDVIYKTSEMGEFLEILNWKKIADQMNNAFDDILEIYKDEGRSNIESLDKALQSIRQLLTSQEAIEQVVYSELQQFHLPFGLEFDTEDTLEYVEELPNTFGGDPISGKSKLFFEKVDVENHFCTMRVKMKLDPEDTKEMLSDIFKKMDIKNKSIKEFLKSSVFEINDNSTYEYYYFPGIPSKITVVRETNMDFGDQVGKRIDITEIELMPS